MPSFTIHLPTGRPADEGAVFISDGWSWQAFIFGPLWLGWHRQWLALLGYIVLWGVLTALGQFLGLHPLAASLLSTLLNVGLALEGGQIRRWTLARKGAPAVAVVSAPNVGDAEVKYFVARRQAAQTAVGASLNATVPSPPATSAPRWPARTHSVIGSFPEPGGR